MRRKEGEEPGAIVSLGDPGNSESATGVEKKEGEINAARKGSEERRSQKEGERLSFMLSEPGPYVPRKSVCAHAHTGEESIYI